MIKIGALVKAIEKIPVAGKYRCIICGLIVDIEQKFIDNGATFFACPICNAGKNGGPIESQDEVWEYLG